MFKAKHAIIALPFQLEKLKILLNQRKKQGRQHP